MTTEAWINRETLQIEGFDTGRPYTAAEFAKLQRPACPVCGQAVNVGQVNVDSSRGDDRWIVGRWECPRGCDPRTGS